MTRLEMVTQNIIEEYQKKYPDINKTNISN